MGGKHPCEHQGQEEEVLQVTQQSPLQLVARPGHGRFLTGIHGGPRVEQVYSEALQACGKAYAGAGERCEEEGIAETSC